MVTRQDGLHRALTYTLVTVLAVLAVASIALLLLADDAEGYRFEVEKEYVEVAIKKDGSVDITYSITFVNYAPLDGVDIGLPNKHYDEGSARARVFVGEDRYEPERIHKSPYVEVGMAVEFDVETQQATYHPNGQRFTLWFTVNNPRMVYENEIEEGTVGIRFRPTWFSDRFQEGPTENLTIVVFFPRGFDGKDPVWLKGRPWHELGHENVSDLWYARWTFANAYPYEHKDGRLDVGVGFDEKYVDKYYKHGLWEKFTNFMSATGSLCATLWLVWLPASLFTLAVVGYIYDRRRRLADYFDPILTVKGAGPRKDLTAVEAAVVLERPMSMVATMILFSVTAKGFARIVDTASPMRVQKLRFEGEHEYETMFLEAIDENHHVVESKLQTCLVKLVNVVEAKVRGFDLSDTRKYYMLMCERAWVQVQEAGTPTEFAEKLTLKNDWLMLDKRYRRRMDRVADRWYDDHDRYDDYWEREQREMRREKEMMRRERERRYRDTYERATGKPWNEGMGARELAAGYANRVKLSSRNMVSSMKDLSREITKVTNPVPEPSPSSSSSSRGSSYRSRSSSSFDFGGFDSCDCACACACACAGGGR